MASRGNSFVATSLVIALALSSMMMSSCSAARHLLQSAHFSVQIPENIPTNNLVSTPTLPQPNNINDAPPLPTDSSNNIPKFPQPILSSFPIIPNQNNAFTVTPPIKPISIFPKINQDLSFRSNRVFIPAPPSN
ncbi:hypothetical protein QN277_014313 [Acacia crassicarpa]|uniref:Uncharacterized protein n=1 Tax=Acacia crassicarpa TaxID=499986 RepID=A0AAE1IN02_9FABA|nr:hypothetical protein QN277_014313 [Acacia crassicarpa]